MKNNQLDQELTKLLSLHRRLDTKLQILTNERKAVPLENNVLREQYVDRMRATVLNQDKISLRIQALKIVQEMI